MALARPITPRVEVGQLALIGSPMSHATPGPRFMVAIDLMCSSLMVKENRSAFSFIREGFVLLGRTGYPFWMPHRSSSCASLTPYVAAIVLKGKSGRSLSACMASVLPLAWLGALRQVESGTRLL